MRRLAAVAFLMVGLAIADVASAAPIGTNACAPDATGTISVCDIYADYEGSTASVLGALDGNLGGYLLGYTFLLNLNADLSDGFQQTDVAHILVVHDDVFELFSNTVFNLDFDDAFAAASVGAAIDGQSPLSGQLAGCPPITSGVPNVQGVGYCATADVVNAFVNWAIDGAGGLDVLNIHTAFLPGEHEHEEPPPDPDPNPVPEPGTLSLLALGGSAALVSRRRRRDANTR